MFSQTGLFNADFDTGSNDARFKFLIYDNNEKWNSEFGEISSIFKQSVDYYTTDCNQNPVTHIKATCWKKVLTVPTFTNFSANEISNLYNKYRFKGGMDRIGYDANYKFVRLRQNELTADFFVISPHFRQLLLCLLRRANSTVHLNTSYLFKDSISISTIR